MTSALTIIVRFFSPCMIEISDTPITKPIITADELIEENQKIKLPARRMRKLSECTSKRSETSSETISNISNQQKLYGEFTNWKLAPTLGRVKTKRNTIGKLWKHVTKEKIPPFDEEDWLRKLGWFIDELANKKLLIIRAKFYVRIKKTSLQYFQTTQKS